MKKRLISLVLALTLVAAMALPASAYNVAMARSWNGIYYATNDTCYVGQFHCVIESDSAEHTLRTAVDATARNGLVHSFYGNTATMIATNSASVSGGIKYIVCTHYINSDQASSQQVYPG